MNNSDTITEIYARNVRRSSASSTDEALTRRTASAEIWLVIIGLEETRRYTPRWLVQNGKLRQSYRAPSNTCCLLCWVGKLIAALAKIHRFNGIYSKLFFFRAFLRECYNTGSVIITFISRRHIYRQKHKLY